MFEIADLLFLQRVLQFVVLLVPLESLPQGFLQLLALLLLHGLVLDDHRKQSVEVLAAVLVGLGGAFVDA